MNFIALTKEISLHPLNVRKATEGEAEEKLSKFTTWSAFRSNETAKFYTYIITLVPISVFPSFTIVFVSQVT